MNGYRLYFLTLVGLVVAVLSFGCSSGTDDASTSDKPAVAATGDSLSDSAQIARVFHEMIERMGYMDKSGMWENEFSYLRDEQTFDYYLETHTMVSTARKDTLDSVEVVAVDLYKPDSAITDVRLHFTGPTKVQSTLDQQVTLYWRRGTWIKPTVSVVSQQESYDEIIRRADSAAKAEAEGN